MRLSPFLVPAAGLAYLGAHFGATRLIYYPERTLLARPDGAEEVWLRASDGTRLNGWWFAAPGASWATVYLHGNGGNISHRAGHALEIAAAGSSVLLLEYRGYGASSGFPTEHGFYRDADAGYDFLLSRGFAPERIACHGESLGTAVAVDLAVRRPCAGLVLEAPITSVREIAGRVLPIVGPAFVWGYDSYRKIPRVRAPLLVMHGDLDEIVPLAIGERLFAAAHEPKTLWVVPGAGHNNLLETAGPAYREHLRAFYTLMRH